MALTSLRDQPPFLFVGTQTEDGVSGQWQERQEGSRVLVEFFYVNSSLVNGQ